jgi:hypothetical protein
MRMRSCFGRCNVSDACVTFEVARKCDLLSRVDLVIPDVTRPLDRIIRYIDTYILDNNNQFTMENKTCQQHVRHV